MSSRTAGAPSTEIDKALAVLAGTQEQDGSWKGDYGGPLFLLPVYIACLYLMKRPPEGEVRQGFIRHLQAHQRADGGWGLDAESHSHVFTTVLNYVALRLLGMPPTAAGLPEARAFFLAHGGPAASASWGKFILALLSLYDYRGLHPVQPELWLLPELLPVHPSRFWCHSRMVYLPMGYLYGRRYRAEESPLLVELREELYDGHYDHMDWARARDTVAPADAYTPRSALLKAVNPLLQLFERVAPAGLRARALRRTLELIRSEDESTRHVCIGPVNKGLNALVWHVENPGGPEERAHLARLPEYLSVNGDRVNVSHYNSSQLWDTAFAVQAVAATGEADTGASGGAREMLQRAAGFIETSQILEDAPPAKQSYRHPRKGGWPFSNRDQGWPLSDCTGEGLKASLLLEQLGLNRVPEQRLADAVEFILSLQNDDGGWATYELQRGPKWLELLNPSDVFSTIMVEVSYVECTSSCATALAAFRKAGRGASLGRRLDSALAGAARFLRRSQREDGSWEGSWGVCFSYGTWFGVAGLIAAGAHPDDEAIARAVAFLAARQRPDGSWSETAQGCRERRWVEGKDGHAVTTSWALLALAEAGQGRSAVAQRGAAWLRARQGADGRWPAEPFAGVFNRTCAMHYDCYLRIFPPWALARCAGPA